MPGPAKQPAAKRLWSRVEKTETCWLYGGKKYGNHYAQLFGDDGKNTTAHRLSYLIHCGAVPRGKFVCHRCDVRNCVNPAHLYAGDHEDNNRDRVLRGKCGGALLRLRGIEIKRAGTRPGNRKLSLDDRKRCAALYASGKHTQKQLCKAFKVSQATVSAIIRGKRNMGAEVPVTKRTGFYRRKFAITMPDEVRELYATGQFTQQQIADRFGCSQDYVSRLVRRTL